MSARLSPPSRTPRTPASRGPRALGQGVGLALALAAAGCINPDARYDAFVERALSDGPREGGSGGGSAELPEPEQIAGRYLMSVTFDLYPEEPTGYELELKADESDGVYEVSLRQRPLRFAEYQTPVGDWSKWQTTELTEQGIYETPEPVELDVPADANVLDLPTFVALMLRGDVNDGVEGKDGKMEFWCGEAWGEVKVFGIGMDVQGVFTTARIREGEDFPKATINCDGDLAAGY